MPSALATCHTVASVGGFQGAVDLEAHRAAEAAARELVGIIVHEAFDPIQGVSDVGLWTGA